jgi:HEAT repeat protein
MRALATGEERVSLAGFNEDELVDRFKEFCLRDFMATNFFNLHNDQAQIDASNNIITEITRILVALKEHGALGRLVALLKHENQNVRLWAAHGALFVDEEAALATLAAIAEEGVPESARMFVPPSPGLTNVYAMQALELWREKRRGVYGLNPGDKPPP